MTTHKVTDEGKRFVVIQIREFSDLPTVCKKSGPENLMDGVIYTRSKKKHETIMVPSQEEMREILNMATEKGIQRLHGTIHRAGLRVAGTRVEEDARQFEEQLDGL